MPAPPALPLELPELLDVLEEVDALEELGVVAVPEAAPVELLVVELVAAPGVTAEETVPGVEDDPTAVPVPVPLVVVAAPAAPQPASAIIRAATAAPPASGRHGRGRATFMSVMVETPLHAGDSGAPGGAAPCATPANMHHRPTPAVWCRRGYHIAPV